jgi:hypothetical protein
VSDDTQCLHEWGPPELVECALGELNSPLCVHCGAVKLVEENRAAERRRLAYAAQPINRPPVMASNIPPAGKKVHAVQLQVFTDL